MLRDNRDPEQLGQAILAVRALRPAMRPSEIAARIDRGAISVELVAPAYLNGRADHQVNPGEFDS